MSGQTTEIRESKVARNTKELTMLLWPEESLEKQNPLIISNKRNSMTSNGSLAGNDLSLAQHGGQPVSAL